MWWVLGGHTRGCAQSVTQPTLTHVAHVEYMCTLHSTRNRKRWALKLSFLSPHTQCQCYWVANTLDHELKH